MSRFLTLKPVTELLECLQFFTPVSQELVNLYDALGRVLASPMVAESSLPGFDRSSVDGYAVRAEDVFGACEGIPALLTLIGEVVMAQSPDLTVAPGQTARVWTGGTLPPGANAVVMLERARATRQNIVELVAPVAPGDNVVLADEDVAPGETVLPEGRLLGPAELGLLAALGVSQVMVRRRPRVAIISSGDELVPIERVPKPGQVRDLNAVALGSLIKVWGGEPNYYGIAPDDDSILFNLAQEALKNSDVLVISGGSSAGQRDYTIKTFQALPGAQILAHGVAMSPGKPLILGVIAGDQGVGLGRDPENALNNRYDYEIGHEIDQGVDQSRRLANVRYNDQNNPLAKVDTKDDAKVEANIRPNARLQSLWGLPGHPAGALITAEVFLRPLLARLLGLETAPWPTTLKARMSRPVFSAQGRRDYLRVTLSRDSGGELVASPILGKSALITTITQAAALAICPEDLEGLAAGDWAEIQPLTPGGWLF